MAVKTTQATQKKGKTSKKKAAAKKSTTTEKATKKLFLLDGMALVYRAHFAFMRNPITRSDGMNTSAIYGFANSLFEILQKEDPSHIGVAFDTSAPTFRHEIFPAYKEQRDAMPEELSAALPHVRRLVEALNIPLLILDGYEADDIIGTIATKAQREDLEVYMVTPDKDFAQLVSDKIYFYKPSKGGSEVEVLKKKEICENWEIEDPEQVIDILGLWGDASDNIPGVPGIGEKTAKKLIKQFGSLEEILAGTDQLKGKQKENLEKFAEQARLSKELATIKLDVPIKITVDKLARQDFDKEALAALFAEFEFKTLASRVLGEEGAGTAGMSSIENSKKNYQRIKAEDLEARQKVYSELTQQKSFCFDVETTGLDPKDSELLGIALSWKKDHGYYLEMPSTAAKKTKVLKELAPAFSAPNVEKIGHNLKFDLSVLSCAGLEVNGPFFDTMLVHSLVEPQNKHSMDFLSQHYLSYKPISYEEATGGQADKNGQLELGGLTEVDPNLFANYAAEDADVTWQLGKILKKELAKAGLEELYSTVEAPLIPVLAAMELEGINLDCKTLDGLSVILEKRIVELQKEIFKKAGREFNLNSPKQLGEVLFDELKLVEKPKKTKTGQYVTNEQVLSELANEHEVIASILEYRELSKLKSTYVDALPNAVSGETGRVHTTFLQNITDTGRLASNHPNLQNIPIRTEQGREVRKAFVPRDKDHLLYCADYSQIELRVMAALSGDENMKAAFAENQDIHSATAARVFGVPLEKVTREMRSRAKMVNFGIIYGISSFGLAQRLSISKAEAAEMIDEYFVQYPAIKEYMDSCIESAQENGYVETISGRRRHFRDINSKNYLLRSRAERAAINAPIQGSAADMIKLAMVRVQEIIKQKKMKTRLLLQVHDELVLDVPKSEKEQIVPIVESEMVKALPLDGVAVVVESGFGKTWLEAH